MLRFFVIILILLSVGFSSLAKAQPHSSPPAPTAADAPASPAQPVPSLESSQSLDFTWMFAKTLVSMFVVLALAIIILKYLLPKWSSGRSVAGNSASLKILGRYALDHKKGLAIVQIDGRRLLLGISEQQVQLITELKGSEEIQEI